MLSIYSWMSGLYWKVVSLHRDYTFKTDSVSHQLAIANSSLARTGTSWPPTLSNWNFILLEFAQVLIILSLLVWIPVCNCPDAARKDFLCNSELWLLHFSCLIFLQWSLSLGRRQYEIDVMSKAAYSSLLFSTPGPVFDLCVNCYPLQKEDFLMGTDSCHSLWA